MFQSLADKLENAFKKFKGKGKLTESGTHEELMKTSDIYREVYETQKKGGAEDDE